MTINKADVVVIDNSNKPSRAPTAVELERLFNPAPYRGMQMTAARRAEIECAIFAGLSNKDVAKKFSCCGKTVARFRQELKTKYQREYRKLKEKGR